MPIMVYYMPMARQTVKKNKKWGYIFFLLVFIIYIFIAPRPISEEIIIKPRWISSLESDYVVSLAYNPAPGSGELLPFTLGDRFGYIEDDGKFAIKQNRKGYISLSEDTWAEYESLPSSIQIMNPHNEAVLTIEKPEGYPLFLDKRTFIIGSGQNFITALGPSGEELWTYDFPAPITCIDAAGGFVLAGTLDGTAVLLDSSGIPVFSPFEPGGSRFSVILGCAISHNASRFALISGIDDQRLLLLEKALDTYKVIYHESFPGGFRRPVYIDFVDNDSKLVFEREGGLGIFTINSRSSISLLLEGEITGIDTFGEDGFLFVVTSQGQKEKRLIVIRYPGVVVNEAPFTSENTFFARRDKNLYIGGDLSIASFELEKR